MATLLMSSTNSQRGSSTAQLLRSNGYEVIEMADNTQSPTSRVEGRGSRVQELVTDLLISGHRSLVPNAALVLVDIRGASEDRTSLVTRLQTMQLDEVPVVVLASGPCSEDDIVASPELAAAIWLVEPITDTTLLTCVHTLQHMQRAHAHLRTQNKRVETLMAITDTSWEANSLSEQAGQVLTHTLQALSCEIGGIWLSVQDQVTCFAQHGLNTEPGGTATLHISQLAEMVEHVIMIGQPYYRGQESGTSDQAPAPGTWPLTSDTWPLTSDIWHLVPGAIQPLAIIPLQTTADVIGALMIDAPQSVELSQEDRVMLQEIALRAAHVLQQTQHREQIERTLGQLEIVDRKKDEFLSFITHELKNPMASIKGYADLMVRRMSKGPADSNLKGLRVISQQVTRMTTLLDYLLDFSRINLDRIQLCKDQCDLVALIQGVVEDLRETAKQHEFHIEVANPSIQVVLDEARIYRVVSNLVSNAVKYSPQGSTITVHTWCTMGEHGPEAIISVSDQGIGIPRAEIDHLFERFFRASNVSENDAGLGLGLFLASEIVKRHGGRIWAESQEQQGSTFWVALPLTNEEVRDQEPGVRRQASGVRDLAPST